VQGERDYAPGTAGLVRVWQLVRTGRLRSPAGRLPKYVSLEGCHLVPHPGTKGVVVSVVLK
jgi:hypothetical protein